MNRLENMETFVRIVEAGSISAAAERVGVAVSVASRRLKELEGHLGIELFHRTTRKLNLTDAGESFYRDCLRILEEVEQAETAVAERHERIRGRLRVALPSSFGHMHVGPAILDFLRAHPQIEFDLDFNDREVDLMQEGFDLAIRLAALPDEHLARIPLDDELRDAIGLARRIQNKRSALKRHYQFIGKLLRARDPDPIKAALLEIDQQSQQSIHRHHRAERWRDRILDEGVGAIDALMLELPCADRQKLRQLWRNHAHAKSDARRTQNSRLLYKEIKQTLDA